MYKPRFLRASHQDVWTVLAQMDQALLAQTQCYFGGGTRIVLELGEYRESKDIDFLCASRDGYRLLRETVSHESLGPMFRKPVPLAREVRTDQYGIRTFLDLKASKLKFEIVREARIELEGQNIASLPVPCLTRQHAFAEKFLANTDRGLDASTLSRDMIDLAFMIEGWATADAAAGLAIAKTAYGEAVERSIEAVARKIRKDRSYRNRCIEGLAITEPKILVAGLETIIGKKWAALPPIKANIQAPQTAPKVDKSRRSG